MREGVWWSKLAALVPIDCLCVSKMCLTHSRRWMCWALQRLARGQIKEQSGEGGAGGSGGTFARLLAIVWLRNCSSSTLTCLCVVCVLFLLAHFISGTTHFAPLSHRSWWYVLLRSTLAPCTHSLTRSLAVTYRFSWQQQQQHSTGTQRPLLLHHFPSYFLLIRITQGAKRGAAVAEVAIACQLVLSGLALTAADSIVPLTAFFYCINP